MTERENCLKVYHHEIPEWIPVQGDAIQNVGFWTENERGNRGERINDTDSYDCFGVVWSIDAGHPMPSFDYGPVLEEIEDWEDVVKFPDPDSWDWEALAKHELCHYDGTKVLRYFSEEGLFDRLTALMGFENALCSLIADPDSCKGFFARMAEFKIQLVELVAKHFKPDVFMYTDDLAQASGLFMSPDTYRELIKPYHRQIIQAIRDHGMIAEQHTCGKCEQIIGDYVEIGVQSFFPAQPSNDLQKIKTLYGNKLVICGGFDSQGPCAQADASEEVMRAEARRIVDMYARGGGLVVGLTNLGLSAPLPEAYIHDEFLKYSKDFYKKPENRVW